MMHGLFLAVLTLALSLTPNYYVGTMNPILITGTLTPSQLYYVAFSPPYIQTVPYTVKR